MGKHSLPEDKESSVQTDESGDIVHMEGEL
jgi:hypothetical protein